MLLVSPPPSPPPRGESARGSAAAAIFPPLRTHGARGRSSPPPSPGPGKGPPNRRRCPPAPAFAASSARQASEPGRCYRPSARPAAAAFFAFCFLCSGAPAPARALQGTQRAPPAGPRKAAARACASDPSSSSPRARSCWLRAGAAWRAGGEVAGAFAGGAHLFALLPPEVDREREAGGLREARSSRSSRRRDRYMGGGAPCSLNSTIGQGACAPRAPARL